MSPSQKLKSLTDVKTATFSTAEKIPILKISKILSGLNFTASMPHTIPNNRSPIADSIERDVRVDIKLFFGLVKYKSKLPFTMSWHKVSIPPKQKKAMPNPIVGIDQRYKISDMVMPFIFPPLFLNKICQKKMKTKLLINIAIVCIMKLFLLFTLCFTLYPTHINKYFSVEIIELNTVDILFFNPFPVDYI